MTREDFYKNLIEECRGYDEDLDWVVKDDELADKLVAHENDLLKEFVEWMKKKYKGKFDKQAKTYQHFYEDGFSMQDCEYHRGKLNEIEDLADELDQDLEKFMEERK